MTLRHNSGNKAQAPSSSTPGLQTEHNIDQAIKRRKLALSNPPSPVGRHPNPNHQFQTK